MMSAGLVLSLHVAPASAAPMHSVSEVEAVARQGLRGDRYFTGQGTYSNHPGSGREVTLIELEAVEALQREYQVVLEPAQTRRNIVTRGVALNHLVDKEFRIGAVTLRGTRLCEPCAHLEKLTRKGARRGLVHRGGLRAEVIQGGVIQVGDAIVAG